MSPSRKFKLTLEPANQSEKDGHRGIGLARKPPRQSSCSARLKERMKPGQSALRRAGRDRSYNRAKAQSEHPLVSEIRSNRKEEHHGQSEEFSVAQKLREFAPKVRPTTLRQGRRQERRTGNAREETRTTALRPKWEKSDQPETGNRDWAFRSAEEGRESAVEAPEKIEIEEKAVTSSSGLAHSFGANGNDGHASDVFGRGKQCPPSTQTRKT